MKRIVYEYIFSFTVIGLMFPWYTKLSKRWEAFLSARGSADKKSAIVDKAARLLRSNPVKGVVSIAGIKV